MRFSAFAWGMAWICLLAAAVSAEMTTGMEAADASLRGLWTLPPTVRPSGTISLSLTPIEVYDADVLTFECQIQAKRRIRNVVVTMRVLDEDKTVRSVGEAVVHAPKGVTTCLFHWDTADLPLGAYTAVFETRHSVPEPPARLEVPIRKVTDAQLLADLETLTQRLADLRGVLDNSGGSEASVTPLHARHHIALDVAAEARDAAARRAWRDLDAKLHYMRRTIETIGARLVFGEVSPELLEAPPRPDVGVIQTSGGAFYAEGRPVFLFGAYVARPRPEELARLRRYGLNLAVFPITPADTLSGPDQPAAFAARFDSFFAAAREHNVGLAARLEPCLLGEWAYERWPGLTDKGFVDWTLPGVRETIHRHFEAVLPYLAAQRMVKAASLANNPRFKFDTEAVRQAFLERVRARYPDRPTLNQAWHAHLASFDEITIWDESAQPHEYQNRRAYQFEWQDFHRGMGLEYLQSLQNLSRRLAPDMLLQFDMSEAAFEPGETRFGVDREAVARLGDIMGCEAALRSDNLHYAFHYPDPMVFYALLHSFQPHKPVLNTAGGIGLVEEMPPDQVHDYIAAALWESVISGLSGMAIPLESPVFRIPEALEAFAETALHVNRLAPIIVAFQQAPAEVAILYSDSSKILDDGVPHLQSARYAYEGCSFAGYNVRFVTERQLIESGLGDARVLVLPATPAVTAEAFDALADYVERDGVVARVGPPIPYDERGVSRHNVLRNTAKTVLVRGMNLPTEYLHAMDAAIVLGALPPIPRLINPYGYPIEGVRSRYVELDGEHYLYAVNLRKEAVICHLLGPVQAGRDLIQGRDVQFPLSLKPLNPLLMRLEAPPTPGVIAKAPEPPPSWFAGLLESDRPGK